MARTVLLSPSPVRTFPSIFRATLVVDEVSQKHLEAEERGSRDWREWDTRAEKYGNAIRVVFLTRSPVNRRRSRPPEMPLLSPASSPCLWAQCLA